MFDDELEENGKAEIDTALVVETIVDNAKLEVDDLTKEEECLGPHLPNLDWQFFCGLQ